MDQLMLRPVTRGKLRLMRTQLLDASFEVSAQSTHGATRVPVAAAGRRGDGGGSGGGCECRNSKARMRSWGRA